MEVETGHGSTLERTILDGATIEERLARDGAGFWLRLTDTQRDQIKSHLKAQAQHHERQPE